MASTSLMRRADAPARPASVSFPPLPTRSDATRTVGVVLITLAVAALVGLFYVADEFVGGFNWEPLALTPLGLIGSFGAALTQRMGRKQRRRFREALATALTPHITDASNRRDLAAAISSAAPNFPTGDWSNIADWVEGNWRVRIEKRRTLTVSVRTINNKDQTDWTDIATGSIR